MYEYTLSWEYHTWTTHTRAYHTLRLHTDIASYLWSRFFCEILENNFPLYFFEASKQHKIYTTKCLKIISGKKLKHIQVYSYQTHAVAKKFFRTFQLVWLWTSEQPVKIHFFQYCLRVVKTSGPLVNFYSSNVNTIRNLNRKIRDNKFSWLKSKTFDCKDLKILKQYTVCSIIKAWSGQLCIIQVISN